MSQDEKGSINVYTGLRGRSKSLWRNIKKGSEKRVKTIMYPENNMIQNKVFHAQPLVVIHAIGYGCNVPMFLDENTNLPLEIDSDGSGTLNTTNKCQIYVKSFSNDIKKPTIKKVLKNVVATGLGASLRTSHPDIGGEKLLKNVCVNYSVFSFFNMIIVSKVLL